MEKKEKEVGGGGGWGEEGVERRKRSGREGKTKRKRKESFFSFFSRLPEHVVGKVDEVANLLEPGVAELVAKRLSANPTPGSLFEP